MPTVMGLISLLQENPSLAIVWILAIVYSITIHEFFHALAATLQGDYTAKYEGRLTLNPLAHLDPLGTIALLFIGFGWGRPVPFNPNNLRSSRFGSAIVGLAGPFANLLSVVVFGVVLRVLGSSVGLDLNNLFFQFLVLLIQLNIMLFLFNLLPIPPLDGSKLLIALLPPQWFGFATFLERYGVFLLLAFLLTGGSLLQSVWGSVYNLTLKLIF